MAQMKHIKLIQAVVALGFQIGAFENARIAFGVQDNHRVLKLARRIFPPDVLDDVAFQRAAFAHLR